MYSLLLVFIEKIVEIYCHTMRKSLFPLRKLVTIIEMSSMP